MSAGVDTNKDVDKERYLQTAERDALTVYGRDGDDLDEISDLLVADEGKINNVIPDVGGFSLGAEHLPGVVVRPLPLQASKTRSCVAALSDDLF